MLMEKFGHNRPNSGSKFEVKVRVSLFGSFLYLMHLNENAFLFVSLPYQLVKASMNKL